MAVAAGDLRHSIDIQLKVETTDEEYGGKVFSWSTVISGVRCKVVPVSGKEMITAGAEQSQIRTRFFMRYRYGVTSAMRVVDKSGDIHEIVSVVDVDGQGRFLEVVTKAWVGDR